MLNQSKLVLGQNMLRLQVNRLLTLLGQLSRQGRVILRLHLQLLLQIRHVLLHGDI